MKRESRKSVQATELDDDDDIYIYIYIYMEVNNGLYSNNT